jgi:hypothetical protein
MILYIYSDEGKHMFEMCMWEWITFRSGAMWPMHVNIRVQFTYGAGFLDINLQLESQQCHHFERSTGLLL